MKLSSPEAVLESSLYVSDLSKAIAFYEQVLGLHVIDKFPGDRGAALQVGPGQSALLLFRAEITRQGGLFPPHGASGGGHVAFRVEAGDIPAWRERLKQHEIPIETELTFGNNAPSIYFRDPDRNSLELAVASIWRFRDR